MKKSLLDLIFTHEIENKTLHASIIDSESNSTSKLFTLIYKQTLLDTEPFLLVL